MTDERFSYYARLSAKDKAVYRRSDAIVAVPLPDAASLAPLALALEAALATGKRVRVARAAEALTAALAGQLGAPPVRLHVREVRPDLGGAELHGLYTFAKGGAGTPKLEVWMRTAANERVVKFRTFLRTLLHEIVHHLDVTILALPDSFHTAGFFRRESSLMRQLAPPSRRPAAAAVGRAGRAAPEQLSLFSS